MREELLGLWFYIAGFVFGYAIAYLLLVVDQHTFGWADIDPAKLFWIYVVALFVSIVVEGIVYGLIKRYYTATFIGRLLLVVMYFFVWDLSSNFKHKYVLDVSRYIEAFIFFLLPTILSEVAVRRITWQVEKRLSQFKRKVMVKVKPPKAWNFADYGRRGGGRARPCY